MHKNFNLARPFYENVVSNPESLALFVSNTSLSYRELGKIASRIAGWLTLEGSNGSGRVGILATRSIEAYAGVLGTLWSGSAYVPLNPAAPEERLVRMLKLANLDALIIDASGERALSRSVVEHLPRRILLGSNIDPQEAASRFPGISLSSMGYLPDVGPEKPVDVPEDALAYIIFTSGTTGVPKGVMIETGSVALFLELMQKRYGFRPDDRVPQAFELTFDASVLAVFLTWFAGAGLYVIPAEQHLAPAKFIKDHRLTVSYFVPSVAMFMKRLHMLKPGVFPFVRYSLFGGEALPESSALAWQAAAPNGILENLYGPTEVTVYCTLQRLTDPPNVTPNRGVIAIGHPFEGVQADIVDANLNPVAGSEPGELILSGRQLARGYLSDSQMTAARFPVLRGQRWYRTGDLVCRDQSGALHHLGRIDNQVKVLGNRVELEEVDAHLRKIAGTDMVATVAWPVVEGTASGLVAFHCAADVSRDYIREEMRKRVPDYMVPQRVHHLESLPLSQSGKIDRKALLHMLEDGKV